MRVSWSDGDQMIERYVPEGQTKCNEGVLVGCAEGDEIGWEDGS